MTNIGIVGGGVGGLHLALLLQKRGQSVTLYAEKTPAEQRAARLPNTAIHWGDTRQRERELGVDHWSGIHVEGHEAPFANYFLDFHIDFGDGEIRRFRGELAEPAINVDHRLYLAALLDDYIARGGDVEFGSVPGEALERLSDVHDFVVVASGRGSLTELFARDPGRSPYNTPQRIVCTGLYNGISSPDPICHEWHLSSVGELAVMPFLSFDGPTHALLFEFLPGQSQPVLEARYADDPDGFNAAVLQTLERHFPDARARVPDETQFGLRRAEDVLQGAITPTVRHACAQLPNGNWVMAMADLQVVNDPLAGMGANAASAAAFVMADAILNDGLGFDERFCRETEARLWEAARPRTELSNFVLNAGPNMPELLLAASENHAIAAEFASNFAAPHRNWNILSTPERTATFLRMRAHVAA